VARGDAFHVDTFDLYSARQRQLFIQHAAAELGCREEALKRDVGCVLRELEALQDEQIKKALAPKDKTVAIPEERKAAALARLRAPGLMDVDRRQLPAVRRRRRRKPTC
jgi:hypothetical protein